MSQPIPPGLNAEASYQITDAMVPGHVTAPVVSTPSLISLIEKTCRRAVLPYLPEGQDTVGIHVCVSHERVALVGEDVAVSARLSTLEGRRLTFEVRVEGRRGIVSQGTHRRVVVDRVGFA